MSFAQSVPPPGTSCTSSDLSLVAAQLTGGDLCNSCAMATPLTRTLTLGINNTTGSTRGAFAFWGTVDIYSGTTGLLISSTTRTGCAGPLPGGSITYLDFGTITYNCGDIIKISNLWEAWTTPSGSCPIDPNNISPKCGQLPSITVNAGVNGEFALTSSLCGSATGAIDLTTTGGTAPFTYVWTASAGGVIPAGQSTNQDLTGLVPGTYSVTIKDVNNCTTTKSRTITATTPPPAVFATASNYTVPCGGAATSSLSYTNNPTGTLNASCIISGSVVSTLSAQTPAGPGGGTIIESWTFTDAYGRTITQTRTITVSPAALPTMTSPGNTGVSCGSIPASSTITYTNGLSGACLISGSSNSSTFSATPGACGGTVTETWTATDSTGRVLAPVTRTITVAAAALPTMTAPGNITVACGGLPAASTIAFSNGLSGGCLISGTSNPSTLSATPGACGGTVTETWTGTDSCGRALAPVSRTITVSPAALPTMTALTDITVTCGGLPAASTLPFTNGLGGGCLVSGTSNLSTFTTTVPGNCNGKVTQTWTATDSCGRTLASVSRTITIDDTTAPAFTALPAPSTVSYSTTPSFQQAVATDACSSVTLTFNDVATPTNCNGSYSITRTWTAKDVCNNTSTASQTINVSAAVFVANNDSGNSINGFGGGTSFINVLGNDTLDGSSITSSQVTTSFVSSTNAGVSLSGTNVVVAPGTLAGNYTLTYQICGASATCSCATATVTVPVTVTLIDAVNDTAAPINGYVGGTAFTNVLANDTLNGSPVVPAQVNTTFVSSTNAGVTLSGTNVLVAPGTPAGSYTLTYQICEILNPTNCDQAIVSVSVSAAAIVANDDTAAPINGFVGGTAFTNVLANDTLNGSPVLPAQVITTFVSSTNAGITLSGTNVLVAPGTPSGTYTLTYQICEVLNPTNCDQAIVSISVDAAAIVAMNDTYSVDCANIGTIGNILSNDSLNNINVTISQVNLSIVNGAYPNLNIDANGNVSLTSIGHCGDYTFTYQICEILNPSNCDTATATITIIDNTPPTFTTPSNITLNTDANCSVNLNPSNTGNLTNINDNCDSNPTVSFVDTECIGNSTETNINAGNGNYFYFDVTGFDNATAANIQKIALAFETNQGKGRAEFTLVSPSGQAVILVGPYCAGGNCDDNNSSSQELYLPEFYPTSSGYTQWNNNNFITTGVTQNFTPNGGLSSPNTINGLTSYVSGFENLTGPMNGTWFVYSRKQANVNGSINFKSVCLTPGGLCPNNRVITRTWTVTDACGNNTTGTQTVTIQDITAPTWSTAAGSLDATVECSDAAALTTAQALAPMATDNCAGTVTYVKIPGAFVASAGCSNAGTYTNTWTAKDVCNNISTVFTQVITVQDTAAPIWETADGTLNVTVECGDKDALTAAQGLFPVASDLCDADVTNIIKKGGNFIPALGCANTGTYTNEWTVLDNCGNNSVVFTQTITVIDTTAPTVDTAAVNATVQCDGNGNSAALTAWLTSNGGAEASDKCSNVVWSNNFTTLSDGCGNTGTATVTYTATDGCGNASTTSATFTIEDTTAPTIDTAAANATVECDGNGNTAALQAWLTSNGGAVASDVCSNVIWTNSFTALSDGCGNTGNATVTFTATDDCGNATTTSATFTIEDTTAPTMDTVAANTTVQCDGNGNTAALQAWLSSNGGASASDICSNVTWTNSYNELSDGCGNTGSATVTFTATDDCGNATTTSATFTIEDTTDPTMDTAAANATVECDGNGNTAALQAWLSSNGGAAASDVCSNVTWTNSFDALSDGCGNTGSASVTFTATDDCGNATTTSATFTIEDTTNPSMDVAATDLLVQCDGGGNSAALTNWLASNGGASASDISSNVTWTNNFNALANDCSTAVTVIFTATDDCGNATTTSATFAVQDIIAPTIDTAAVDATVQCDGQGNTAALQAWLSSNGGALASDTCSGVTWTNSFDALSDGCGNSGSATVIFTATDGCGNTSTTSAIFTIEDTTAPTIDTAAANATVECDGNGNPEALTAWLASNGGATASDICSNVTWTNSYNELSDGCGNTGS
ncbi:MAG: hypothetical protein ABIQ27_12645, partial [Flavobacterium sp.]|uniref:beta strand repeat-containing protein n=1 Tax=Flavobacterium sp. TaxID=239 RepID=UPI003266E894